MLQLLQDIYFHPSSMTFIRHKNLQKLPQLKFQCNIKDVTLIIKLHGSLIYTQAGQTKER
jgi:hypothetical protein